MGGVAAVGPLRVWHLGKHYPPAPGGMETHLRTLARAQAALGAEVSVLCLNHAAAGGEDLTWRALARTPTSEDRDGQVRVLRLGRVASVAKLDVSPDLPAALAKLRREPSDVVHLHVPNPTMLLGLWLARIEAPLVVTWHSDVVAQRFRALLLRPFEQAVLRRAGRILCTSPDYASGSSVLAHHQDKLAVLPFGIDLDPFRRPSPAALAEAERLRRELGSPLWLVVGRLVYYKGLATALEALARVPGRLVVVGTGPLESELRRRAASLGVSGRVVFLPHASADLLCGAYHAATALWFPSNARSEAFGLVQVEAMASGCPVLNTAIPSSGVPWVSRDGESGLTVPIDDPEALAGAARRLLDEGGLRARLSAGAVARACTDFDDGAMARRSLDLYAEVRRGGAATAG